LSNFRVVPCFPLNDLLDPLSPYCLLCVAVFLSRIVHLNRTLFYESCAFVILFEGSWYKNSVLSFIFSFTSHVSFFLMHSLISFLSFSLSSHSAARFLVHDHNLTILSSCSLPPPPSLYPLSVSCSFYFISSPDAIELTTKEAKSNILH